MGADRLPHPFQPALIYLSFGVGNPVGRRGHAGGDQSARCGRETRHIGDLETLQPMFKGKHEVPEQAAERRIQDCTTGRIKHGSDVAEYITREEDLKPLGVGANRLRRLSQ